MDIEPGPYWFMSKDKRYKDKWVSFVVSDEDYDKMDPLQQFDVYPMRTLKNLRIGPKIDEPIESLFHDVECCDYPPEKVNFRPCGEHPLERPAVK